MKRLAFLAVVVSLGTSLALAQASKPAPESTSRTLKVKLNYTGAGTVDEKHKIFIFLFDSPDFVQGNGNVMPIASGAGAAKDATVTFDDTTKSPVYLAAIFDPAGNYDAQSMPPTGSSLGIYTTSPPQPDPVKVEPGKTVHITLAFDDTAKML